MPRASRALPTVSLALYTLFCLTTAAGPIWRPEWDSAIYLLAGQSLAAGEGYSYLGQPFTLRPPGFSWLLSFFVGEAGYDLRVLNLLIASFAAGAVAALYIVLQPLHGRWIALAVAILSGTGVYFVHSLNSVLSEFPFILLLAMGIGLLHRSMGVGSEQASSENEPRGRWWAWSLAGGLCIAGAAYLRTVAVVILPCVLALSLLRDRGCHRVRSLLPLAVVSLLLLPWHLHSCEANSAAQVPSEQLLLHSYGTALFHTDPGDPASPIIDLAELTHRVASNANSLIADFSGGVLRARSPIARAFLAFALVAGIAATLCRRPSLLEGYALASSLLLLVYFTYTPRLAIPLAPFVYLYLLLAVNAFGAWMGGLLSKPRLSAVLTGAACASLFAVNLATLPYNLDRALWPAGNMRAGDHWANIRLLADWLRENTSEDAVILCDQAPVLSFLSGRIAYTYRFARREGLVERTESDYVVFDGPVNRAIEFDTVARNAKAHWTLQGRPARVRFDVFRVK